jgi:hypothetical protein
MDRALLEAVRSRAAALQQLDVTAIEGLPTQRREELPALGKVAVIEYHDVTDEGDHRVVVQAARQRWFGMFTATAVDGFVLRKDGGRRSLTEPEKWPYT